MSGDLLPTAARSRSGTARRSTTARPGWHCGSRFVSPQLEPHTAYKGVCQNKKDLRRVFSWEPQSGYDDGPVNPPPTPTPESEPTAEPV